PQTGSGSLGQLTLALLLAQVVDGPTAERASDAWGADHYVSWEGGGKRCARLTVTMDTPDQAAKLGEALAQWKAKLPGAVVEGSGPFTLTRCV
ncbi:MAG: hypothetical protein ACRDY7_11665, partial [Acidimicrobiia bacterium]